VKEGLVDCLVSLGYASARWGGTEGERERGGGAGGGEKVRVG
jgi:hypothetical protein